MLENEDDVIEDLIHSFTTYGLGDIKHNTNKPIAAFILSICFIDQLASFRYMRKMSLTDRWEKFIVDYMPTYSGMEIYKYFRNTLVHNYSSRGKFALTNEETFKEEYLKTRDTIIINTNAFI